MATQVAFQRLEVRMTVGLSRFVSEVKAQVGWIFAAVAVVLALVAPLPKHGAPAATLRGSEQTGRSLVTWASGRNARLEIVDGNSRTTVPVNKQSVGVTYTSRSSEVKIRLIDVSGEQPTITVCFLNADTRHDIPGLRLHMADMRAEAQALRIKIRNDLAQIQLIQTIADRLLDRTPIIGPHPSGM
jgi:hypothetical protein